MDFTRASNRIYLEDQHAKLLAEVSFPILEENVVNINHTFVDPSLRGQGIASLLMEEAVATIRISNWTVVATCPYAAQWFETHPEHKDILKK